jgi:hypothetical protein
MRRNPKRQQFRLKITGSILTCHPYTVVACRERDLTARLDPYVLESKHQCRIALNLLTDASYNYGLGPPRRDHRHGHVVFATGRYHAPASIRRDAEFRKPRDDISVRAAHRKREKFHEAPLNAVGNYMLPAARLNVHFLPGKPDNVNQEAFGQPVLAHYPHRQRPAGVRERKLTISLDPQQAVTLHPRDGLAYRGAALREALGNARTQRDDTFLFQFKNRAKVHLGGVDQPVRRQGPPPFCTDAMLRGLLGEPGKTARWSAAGQQMANRRP